jgi:hypothetical protein
MVVAIILVASASAFVLAAMVAAGQTVGFYNFHG